MPSPLVPRHRSRARGALLVLATVVAVGAFALGLIGCGDRPAGAPRHIFLITIDTLRADHLGFMGYGRDTSPNLDRLAAQGVVFEHAIAQWPKTGPSFASFFLGRYPQTTGLTHKAALPLPEEYLTLAELLSADGYTTGAVISNGVLPERLGWNAGFGEYLQTWTLAGRDIPDPYEYREYSNASRVNELALPLLERMKDAPKTFVWLHYTDPHAPYTLPTGATNPFIGDALFHGDEQVVLAGGDAAALDDHRDLKHYVAHYDANIRVADGAIGDVLARARALGLLDDALVVFTADHGEALGEHDYFFGHGRLPHQPGLHVPLVIWRPGVLKPHRVADLAELVDLYPTLRELATPKRPVPGLDGESLVPFLGVDPPPGSAEPRYAFAQAGGGSPLTHFRTVQDAGWKLVYHPAVGGAKPIPRTMQLYDLRADPGELRDVFAARPDEARRLSSVLSRWMKGGDWIQIPRALIAERSRETAAALKALGYAD